MSLINRVANLFRRARVDREINDELRAHIEMRTEDNVRAGMSPEEARRDALLRFGNRTVMHERANRRTPSKFWPASAAISTMPSGNCATHPVLR
jgi:hypothetical protein